MTENEAKIILDKLYAIGEQTAVQPADVERVVSDTLSIEFDASVVTESDFFAMFISDNNGVMIYNDGGVSIMYDGWVMV